MREVRKENRKKDRIEREKRKEQERLIEEDKARVE